MTLITKMMSRQEQKRVNFIAAVAILKQVATSGHDGAILTIRFLQSYFGMRKIAYS